MTKKAAKPQKRKIVPFGKKPESHPPANMDKWVTGQPEAEASVAAGPIKRLTIDLPASLHSRVKIQCVEQNLIMAQVVRDFLEQRFPAK